MASNLITLTIIVLSISSVMGASTPLLTDAKAVTYMACVKAGEKPCGPKA